MSLKLPADDRWIFNASVFENVNVNQKHFFFRFIPSSSLSLLLFISFTQRFTHLTLATKAKNVFVVGSCVYTVHRIYMMMMMIMLYTFSDFLSNCSRSLGFIYLFIFRFPIFIFMATRKKKLDILVC